MSFLFKFLGLVGTLDEAGEGYEPSPLAKKLAVAPKSDFKRVEFEKTYSGDKKVLVICTNIRYMVMKNEKKFSSGNHPVEVMQPMMHLLNAGFKVDIATPDGTSAKIEEWALPKKDETIMTFWKDVAKPMFEAPLSLADIVSDASKLNSYVCFYTPGGQGAMLGLPEDPNLGKLLTHVKEKDLFMMSVCHGPATLLAAKEEPHPYKGYKIACFPDSGDKISPKIGYMPGVQTWYFGEKLIERGIEIVNKDPDGTFVEDRKLLTGASPKACQELGVTAAKRLLEAYA